MVKEITTKKSNYIKFMAAVLAVALLLTGCQGKGKNEVENSGDNTTTAESSAAETEASTTTTEITEAATDEGTTTAEETATTTTTPAATTTTAAEATGAGIRPDFKEAMDSYEAFIDEYIAFMKKYQNASATEMLGMLSDYTDYLEKYGEAAAKMQEWEGDLNDEEMKYYLEVMTRINKKLADAAIA